MQVQRPADNVGPSIRGLGKDDGTAQEEFAAFDQLRPLTRNVINEKMCVSWSSHKTLEIIKRRWLADPLNPSIDHNMAEMLLRVNAEIIAEIRTTVETKLHRQKRTWNFARQ